MELASCHPAGTRINEVAPRFLDNLSTPALHILKVCKEYSSAARYDRNICSKSEHKLSFLRKLFVEIGKNLTS
jgi:hypothetical protein